MQVPPCPQEPYGCPDLPLELQRCGLRSLRRLVLWRGSVTGAFCRHDLADCTKQKVALTRALDHIAVLCSECDLTVAVAVPLLAEHAEHGGAAHPAERVAERVAVAL